jgi:hypothetical protein
MSVQVHVVFDDHEAEVLADFIGKGVYALSQDRRGYVLDEDTLRRVSMKILLAHAAAITEADTTPHEYDSVVFSTPRFDPTTGNYVYDEGN